MNPKGTMCRVTNPVFSNVRFNLQAVAQYPGSVTANPGALRVQAKVVRNVANASVLGGGQQGATAGHVLRAQNHGFNKVS